MCLCDVKGCCGKSQKVIHKMLRLAISFVETWVGTAGRSCSKRQEKTIRTEKPGSRFQYQQLYPTQCKYQAVYLFYNVEG